MFGFGKKARAKKALIYWIAMNNYFISENDRIYDGLLKYEGSTEDKASQATESSKYLFRVMASAIAVSCAIVESHILDDEKSFNDLIGISQLNSILGTECLLKMFPTELDGAIDNHVAPIDLTDEHLAKLGGAKLHENILQSLPKFLLGDDSQLPTLRGLYDETMSLQFGSDLPDRVARTGDAIWANARVSSSQHRK